jgi:hypothetical protein
MPALAEWRRWTFEYSAGRSYSPDPGPTLMVESPKSSLFLQPISLAEIVILHSAVHYRDRQTHIAMMPPNQRGCDNLWKLDWTHNKQAFRSLPSRMQPAATILLSWFPFSACRKLTQLSNRQADPTGMDGNRQHGSLLSQRESRDRSTQCGRGRRPIRTGPDEALGESPLTAIDFPEMTPVKVMVNGSVSPLDTLALMFPFVPLTAPWRWPRKSRGSSCRMEGSLHTIS